MLKAYKYRLFPTATQQRQIDHTIGVCRLVYNLGLEVKMRAYREQGVRLSSFDLCYQLVELKKEYSWIESADSQALQASVKKIDIAFQNFFRGAGYPKFKSKRKGIQSFQCPNNTRKIDWKNNTLTIPKIKDIPIILSRRFDGEIKTVTISKTPTGKYFASILVENKKMALPAKPPIKQGTTIGVDVGIKNFVVCSNGKSFEPNRHLKNNIERLKVLQRRVSRKIKGSNNRKKANLCVAILHERISNSRLDYIHKITHALTHDNQVDSIVVEDLNVSGLLKNRKLSQSITDVSFGKFFDVLKYKCEWYGKNLIQIGRFDPSSKRCSVCGTVNSQLTLADRQWDCSCGASHNRDLNASINIKWYGLEQTIFKNKSGEDIPEEPVELRRLRRTKKQEDISV